MVSSALIIDTDVSGRPSSGEIVDGYPGEYFIICPRVSINPVMEFLTELAFFFMNRHNISILHISRQGEQQDYPGAQSLEFVVLLPEGIDMLIPLLQTMLTAQGIPFLPLYMEIWYVV